MDRGDFLLGVGTVVGGALLVVLVEFLRSQIDRRQRSQDRRDDFQEQTLIALQDAIDTMSRNGATLVARRSQIWKPLWRLADIPYNDPEARDAIAALIRMNTLVERVRDDKARALVSEFDDAFRQAILAKSKDEMLDRWEETREIRTRTNQRIGELLRSL